MARRRSARLAHGAKPSRASPNLSSLAERQETPDTAPAQSLDAIMTSPLPGPQTPGESSPPKPPMSEMHPSRVHKTMAPPSSGLRLGFRDIDPSAALDGKLPAAVHGTPSKIALPPSSPFTFRFAHEAAAPSETKLSAEAQRLMDSIRSDVAKYKAELAVERERERQQDDEISGRKFAKPKGKSGRFSAVHMAEFKKMDSIANHPSAFRAQPGSAQAGAGGLKRSPSKPDLDKPEASSAPRTSVKRSQSRANLHDPKSAAASSRAGVKRSQSQANWQDSAASAPLHAGIKRSQSKANLTETENVGTKQPVFAAKAGPAKAYETQIPSPAKRARQELSDDATTNRPVSRDASFLPRPKSAGKDSGMPPGIPRSKSSLASLMTTTKSSLARATTVKNNLHGSPHKTPVKMGGLTHSATVADLELVGREKPAGADRAKTRSPSGLDRVKAMLRGHRFGPGKAKSNLPLPSASTLKPARPASRDKELPPIPSATPGGRLTKRVAFTPETARIALYQQSPSPVKAGSAVRSTGGDVFYPALDSVVSEAVDGVDVSYADLESRRPLPEPPIKTFKAVSAEADESAAGPSNFTFRADHTISFGSASAPGSGHSPGQASVRQVRHSNLAIPGSFPTLDSASGTSSDKENRAPTPGTADLLFAHGGDSSKPTVVASPLLGALPHGMASKKRHRVSTDEQDAEEEAAARAAKKRRPVPEGDALLAPRLTASVKKPAVAGGSASGLASGLGLGLGTGTGTGTTSPSSPSRAGRGGVTAVPSPGKKKRGGLSLSRLNMLARPKMRR